MWMERVDEVGPAFADGVAERDERDQFAADNYRALRERGFLTMQVPVDLGGGGASHSATVNALRSLARYDASTALALAMHQHLLSAQVFQHRAGNPRATKLLSRVASEGLVLVSTGGRDWLESNGTLTRVEGGYRLDADKAFASGAPLGDLALTSARYDHPTDGAQVLHFGVSMRADGVSVSEDWVAHGMRGTGSHTLRFRGVFVPDEAIALTRPAGKYHPTWSVVLTVALPLICAVYVGVAEQAAELARPFARRRASDPAVQLAVGEMDSARILAEVALDGMTALANDLAFAPSLATANRSLALKTAVIDAAQRCVEGAVQAAGGAAFYRRTGIERLQRDMCAGQFHVVLPQAQRLFTGRVGLDLDPAA